MFRKAGRKNEWTITVKAPPQNGKVSAEKDRRQKKLHLCKECVFDLLVIDNNANGFHSDERTVSGFGADENLSILYRLFNISEKEMFADLYGGFFHTVYRLFDKIEDVSNT
ncbi:hypothetical protein [Treponema socranskii]|uniref:hypothetical protein n=1 Tax=Treponema socranskii TaxID=53419 RepID=UPI003D8D7911